MTDEANDKPGRAKAKLPALSGDTFRDTFT
jgi:hypothetical protein